MDDLHHDLLGQLIRPMVMWFWHVFFLGRVITRDVVVYSIGHPPFFKILLQTEFGTPVMTSPSALTKSAGMLSSSMILF